MTALVLTITLRSSDIPVVPGVKLVFMEETHLDGQIAARVVLSSSTPGPMAEFMSELSKRILLSTSVDTSLRK